MASPVTISSLEGSTPVQGRGTVADGRYFYFRARHTAWELTLGATEDEAIDGSGWAWSEPWGDTPYAAGYMDEEIAQAIIGSCGEMIAAGVAPPRAYDGESEDRKSARRVAQMIVYGICMDQSDELEAAGANARAALASYIEEGRAAFREETAPELHALYEEALVELDARAKRETAHVEWLIDGDSARSVGKRWAAMLELLEAPLRQTTRADGVRWLTAWTPAGPVRDAWYAELAPRR